MSSKDILLFFESSLFANICTFLSSIGTIAAVIVSLYLSRKGERIKYKITRDTIIPVGFVGNYFESYFAISLINLSKGLSITIESNPYIKCSKNNLTIIHNIDWDDSNQLPKVINYGEKYKVTMDKKTVGEILEKTSGRKIKFVFKDIFGKTYSHNIKRKELEQFYSIHI